VVAGYIPQNIYIQKFSQVRQRDNVVWFVLHKDGQADQGMRWTTNNGLVMVLGGT